MALDKQTTAKGRLIAKPNAPTKTPTLAGRARASGSPASDVSTSLRRDTRSRAGTPNHVPMEEVSTPVKAFLSSNITPRSGSRKARLESESPTSATPTATPNGTPSRARPVSMIDRWDDGLAGRAHGASALGISGIEYDQDERAQSVISDGSGRRSYTRPLSVQSGPVERRLGMESPEDSPMFFRADEFKPRVPSKPDGRPVLKTVFSGYAQDGPEEDEKSRSSLSTSPPLPDSRPKFFRANSSNDAISPQLKLAKGPPLRRTPQPAQFRAQTPTSQQRAASPLKDEITSRNSSMNDPQKAADLSRKSSLNKPPKEGLPTRQSSLSSPRRHTRLVSNSSNTIVAPEAITTNHTRISSLNTPSPRQSSHKKAASVSGPDTTPKRRNSLATSDFSPSSPTQVYTKPRPRPASISHGDFGSKSISSPPFSIAHTAPIASKDPQTPQQTSPPSTSTVSTVPPPPSPPRPPGQSRLDHLNELAANARRERKVLDLEISNSSLLAINRTLEREMRKQKDELRRLRRTTDRTAASRVVSGATNSTGRASMLSGPATTEDGDPYSDELSSLGGFDDDEDMRSLSSSTSSPPPDRSSFTRDTKRLQFDFSRHRTLLVDSQKLNQSIKRCLDTTESLINDGKKALAYRPKTPDADPPPQKGGRVLAHEEEDEDSPRQGLLSPGISHASQTNPWDSVLMDDVTTSINELQSQLPWHDEGIGDPDLSIDLEESASEPSLDAHSIDQPPEARPQTPPPHSDPLLPTSPKHIPLPPSSPGSPSKSGWDAIKADVKTPDGLRGLGLGGYLQSLGGGFGGLVAGGRP